MALNKMVNGEVIPMTGEEEAEFLAEQSANALPLAVSNKVAEIKAEGLSRIQAVMPAIVDFDTLELFREFWQSIVPAAQSPSADLQSIISIHQAGKSAVTTVKSMTDVAVVNAYDAVADPGWPA